MTLLTSTVAATLVLVWIGELITENGVGNGVSIIIFGGIVAGLPGGLANLLTGGSSFNLVSIILFARHRPADDCRHHPHQRGRAEDPGAVRAARARSEAIRRAGDDHPAARQLGRHDPAHLRGQYHDPAVHDRELPRRRRTAAGCATRRGRRRCSSTRTTTRIRSATSCWSSASPSSTPSSSSVSRTSRRTYRRMAASCRASAPVARPPEYLTRVLNRITLAGALFLGIVGDPAVLRAAAHGHHAVGSGQHGASDRRRCGD